MNPYLNPKPLAYGFELLAIAALKANVHLVPSKVRIPHGRFLAIEGSRIWARELRVKEDTLVWITLNPRNHDQFQCRISGKCYRINKNDDLVAWIKLLIKEGSR